MEENKLSGIRIWTPGFDSPIFCEFKTGFRLKKFEKLILPPKFYESMFFQTILLTGFRAKFENMIIYKHSSTKFGVPQFFDTRNRLKMVLKLSSRYLWLNSAILVFSAGIWTIYHYILSFSVYNVKFIVANCPCNFRKICNFFTSIFCRLQHFLLSIFFKGGWRGGLRR